MRKLLLGLAFVFGATLSLPGTSVAEEKLEIGGLMGERVQGNVDAPVTLIEYSSLTCPHCATFHADALPKIKEKYIDTGKVRLVMRDFPFDRLGLTAAVAARCVDEKRYFGLLDVLFKQQRRWASDPDPIGALGRLTRLAGLSENAFKACLTNEELANKVLSRRIDAEKKYKVNSTPTFFINGEKVEGAQPFETFEKVIEAALK
ncbi:MAG: DsbA family protein [Rhodospirillales bacterium]|nr:DsbA family protein [Rhodospirillales bacterium]